MFCCIGSYNTRLIANGDVALSCLQLAERTEKARADGDQDELRRLSMKKAAANQEAATDANE